MSEDAPIAGLPDDRRSFLRQLFAEGYSAGRYRNPRWLREDLYQSYEAVFGTMQGFSEILDDLAYRKLIGMETSPSGSVRYHLYRSAIDCLAADLANPVDSSQWTGVPSASALRTEEVERLTALLDEVDEKLLSIDLSNSERSTVRAYICAARVLAEAPEPPADMIWELIDRANKLAGVAGLFVAIFALFAARGS